MLKKKEWNEFQDTGLLLIVNQILHIFGWALVLEEDVNGTIATCYPVRTKYRGFSEDSTKNAYKKLSRYMMHNGTKLFIETI